MTLKVYKEFWKQHIRPWSGLPLFPRDMSSRDSPTTIINGQVRPHPLNRNSFISEQQYLTSVGTSYTKKDYYIQVFSDWQIEKHIYDTIFFEIDVHPDGKKQYAKLEEAIPVMLEIKEVIDSMLDDLGIARRCFFTGGRGFHYYLDFEPVFMTDYKATVTKFLKDINIIDLVDIAVIEPARIARLPFTKHLKVGGYAVYVDATNTTEIIETSLNNYVLVEPVANLQETTVLELLDLGAVLPKPKAEVGYAGKYDGPLPDCVIKIMEKILVDQHAKHEERIHLAGYLKRFNYDEEEIVDHFRNTSDFQYDLALGQVRSIPKSGHYNCVNVRRMMPGVCPGICEYIRQVARRRDDDV